MSSEIWAQAAQSNGYENESGLAAETANGISRVEPAKAMQGSGNGHKASAPLDAREITLRDSLIQIIRRLTPNATLREDMLQEAMVHLWLTETRRPGQTRSWYLQSCRFHLQHYLNCGRSIDSAKRWRDQLPFAEHSDSDLMAEQADAGNSVFTCVSAREIMALLAPHLSTQEKAVLICLAEGLGSREIGRKLNLSHTMAIRHRRKIASLFERLEVQPIENFQIVIAKGPHAKGNGKARKRIAHTPLPF